MELVLFMFGRAVRVGGRAPFSRRLAYVHEPCAAGRLRLLSRLTYGFCARRPFSTAGREHCTALSHAEYGEYTVNKFRAHHRLRLVETHWHKFSARTYVGRRYLHYVRTIP